MPEVTARLRERIAAALRDCVLQLHLGQALVAHRGVVHLSARQAETIADVLLPVVEALTAEETALRGAAPAESQGAAALERITVESVQQLVETRTQLAEVEADRDRLARKLDATVRARNEAIEALDEMQCDRDRLAAEVAELEKRLARSQQSRRNLRGLLEHHRDMGSLGMLRQHRNRLSRALRACARYRTEVAELRTEVTKRQAYLETLRERAGKNYGDAKKLRRWLDEERDAVKMYCAEADAAAATVARLRAAVSRALDLLGREQHYESSYTAQGIAVLREAHDGTGEASC